MQLVRQFENDPSNGPINWCRVEIILENGAVVNFEADIVEEENQFVKDVLYFHKFGEKPSLNGIQSGKVIYKFDGNSLDQKTGTSLSIDISRVLAVVIHQLSSMELN